NADGIGTLRFLEAIRILGMEKKTRFYQASTSELYGGVLPTKSSPNWKSMISGSDTEQHGVTSNEWERDKFVLPPSISGLEEIYPTIFGILRQQRPDSKIGAVYDWKGFGRLLEQSALDYDGYLATGKEELSEDETTELAVDYIKNEKPDFLFVHLDHVDHAGHEFGHGSPEYNEAVTKADTLIGNVLEAAKDSGIYEETLFIVSADHGGVGTKHGGETLEELEIPFMLMGPGIKKHFQIPHPVMTYDNAATVAYVFGLETAYAWIGRPVRSAFE
ncbi:MAG: alkaline phosphatase family protein, partial [Verrucomicrobiae bacterium]|nr:alkaline phosphatase family protein [Verrucomicrobiae bacterium]